VAASGSEYVRTHVRTYDTEVRNEVRNDRDDDRKLTQGRSTIDTSRIQVGYKLSFISSRGTHPYVRTVEPVFR